MKGQVSFEALFILLIGVTAAAYITTLYLSTDEVTTITAIARNELTSQTNSFKQSYVLIKVKADVNYSNNSISIDLTTSPSSLVPGDYNWSRVKQKISAKTTSFTTFNAIVNGIELKNIS